MVLPVDTVQGVMVGAYRVFCGLLLVWVQVLVGVVCPLPCVGDEPDLLEGVVGFVECFEELPWVWMFF